MNIINKLDICCIDVCDICSELYVHRDGMKQVIKQDILCGSLNVFSLLRALVPLRP